MIFTNKIKSFIARVKVIWNIGNAINELDNRTTDLSKNVRQLSIKVNEHTDVHVDVHMRQPSIVIAIGRYKNRDYVRVFEVSDQSLPSLIDHLREEEKYARLGRVDMMGGFDISAVYDRRERL